MREIIINKNYNEKNILLVENGILVEKYNEKDNHNRLEGNIYIRKNTKCFTRDAELLL